MCGAFALGAAVVFVSNWLALIPWRRNRDKHWTEQARLLFPVRKAANAAIWSVPCIVVLLAIVLRARSGVWIFAGIGAAIGVAAGNFPLDHEIFPAIPRKRLWRWTAINCVNRLFLWMAFIGAVVWMPHRFGWRALGIGAGIVIFWLYWTTEGAIWLWRKLGLLVSAPERLMSVVTETSFRMQIPFREVLLLEGSLAQAYAMPVTGRLIFTEQIVALLPDDELSAICAHELGHLAESWPARYSRYIRSVPLLPWIYFKPLYGLLGPGGVLMATGLVSIITSRIFKSISTKLEARADGIAKASESDAGTYARALTRVYENNLIPAVHGKATHPSLYDRVLAAGITPDYPRPASAKNMTWYGAFLMVTAGALLGYLLVSVILPK